MIKRVPTPHSNTTIQISYPGWIYFSWGPLTRIYVNPDDNLMKYRQGDIIVCLLVTDDKGNLLGDREELSLTREKKTNYYKFTYKFGGGSILVCACLCSWNDDKQVYEIVVTTPQKKGECKRNGGVNDIVENTPKKKGCKRKRNESTEENQLDIPFFYNFDKAHACAALKDCVPGVWLCRPSNSEFGGVVFAVKLSKKQWKKHYPNRTSEEKVAEYLAVPVGDGLYKIRYDEISDRICQLIEVPKLFNFFEVGYTGKEHYYIPVSSEERTHKAARTSTSNPNTVLTFFDESQPTTPFPFQEALSGYYDNYDEV